MKNALIIIALLLIGFQSKGQNNIIGYAYWFDRDFGSQTAVDVSPAEQLSVDMLIGTEGLSNGLHSLNFRSWDENGQYSGITSQFFYKIPAQTMLPERELVAYEFWFDQDYATAQYLSISGTQTFDYIEVLSAAELNIGIHTFNIRFKDSVGQWSSIVNHFFYKVPEVPIGVEKAMVSYEYWMDNEHAQATTVEVANQEIVEIVELMDLSALSNGIHTFNIRFKDNIGQWSSIVNQFFYKVPEPSGNAQREIVSYEYWFDHDYDIAQVFEIGGAQILDLSEVLELSDLNTGLHTISLRFKDNTQSWSSTVTHFFFKIPETNLVNNKVVSYRYWFNDSFEESVDVILSEPIEILDLNETLDLSQLQAGDYSVHFQFKDSLNLWSLVSTDSLVKNSLPVAFFDFEMDLNCDSTVVNFMDLSVDADVYDWDFGDGSSSVESDPMHTYQNPGDYLVSLMVADTINGLDSTLNMFISVESLSSYAQVEALACDNYTSPSGLFSWEQTGVYTDTLLNYLGCDSILEIDLTILNSSISTLDVASCDPYESPSGLYIWEITGMYSDTLVNALGCDSVIQVDLTILETTYTDFSTSSCESYLSPSGLFLWTESGMYQDTVVNALGCDSIMTIDLTIIQPNIEVVNSDPVLVAQATGVSYQWIDCSTSEPIEGETGQEFEAVMNGSYAVQITQDGCEAQSECEPILNVGIIESGLANEITLFPNPTRHGVSVKMGTVHTLLLIQLYSTDGTLVQELELRNISEFEMSLPYAPGLYFLSILGDGKSARIKVIKE